MNYIVEKGIPVLNKDRYRIKYPFTDMEIGDSFVVPLTEASRLRSSIANFVRGSGIGLKYVTRTIGEEVRCWRVK
ncbi:MAG: hypothetical protein NVS1B10_08410 [Candidatus Saccharimonadales bacterium]